MKLVACILLFLVSSLISAFICNINQRKCGIPKMLSMSVKDSLSAFQLTNELQNMVSSLRNVPDDKLRYQQLLFIAAKARPMPAELKTPENKVPGCLSTVYVHATMQDGKVFYLGDSDSQLTKGLVTLLVNGLSNNSVEDVLAVKPEFIQYAGIAQSLTPGRNSGFLNMLALMKRKASSLQQEGSSSLSISDANANNSRPIYKSMMTKLQLLKPSFLEIEDESHKHAGHAGMGGSEAKESHFKLSIVASCFEGLSLVQRHKMIYTLLSNEMSNGIHALSISAKTPSEVA